MNKNKLLPILILLIILFVGAYFLYNNRIVTVENPLSKDDDATINEVDSEGSEFSGSVKDLLKLGKNYTCDFSYTDEENGYSTKGTIYVSAAGNKMSAEYETILQDETTVKASTLSDGEYMYMWATNMEGGLKMKMDMEATDDNENPSEALANPESLFNNDSSYKYKCRPWIVNNSKFVAPSNIDFSDFSEMMNSVEDVTGDEVDACSYCNLLPEGDSRDDCLADCN